MWGAGAPSDSISPTGAGRAGSWSREGCKTQHREGTVVCLCSHLTYFAVLMVHNPSSLPVFPLFSSAGSSVGVWVCVGVCGGAEGAMRGGFCKKIPLLPPIFPAGGCCVGPSCGSPHPHLSWADPGRKPEPACAGVSHLHQHRGLLHLSRCHLLHPPALLLLQVEPHRATPCHSVPCAVPCPAAR